MLFRSYRKSKSRDDHTVIPALKLFLIIPARPSRLLSLIHIYLRTALYTYLMAKHEDGTFILRIEDTAQGRYVEGAVDVIYNTQMCIRDSLYNMVRILAGTLGEAGAGRLDPTEIPAILESRDRSRAGPTLPAKGKESKTTSLQT